MCKGASPLPFLPHPLLPVPSPFVPPPWGKPGCAPEVAARQPWPSPSASARARRATSARRRRFFSSRCAGAPLQGARALGDGVGHVPRPRSTPALAFRFFRGVEARGDTFNLASVCSSSKIL